MIQRRKRPYTYIASLITFCFVGNLHTEISCSAFTLNVRCKTIGAFSSCPSIATMQSRTSTTSLDMAKGGMHGKKSRMLQSTKKKKKTKNPNKVGKHRKTTKRDDMYGPTGSSKAEKKPSSAPTTKPKISILGQTKSGGPPWQVMGGNDMKKNVHSENVRRDRIKSGIDSPSAGNFNKEQQKADVSGSNQLLSTTDRAMLSWKRFNPQSAPSDLTMVGAYLSKQLPPSLGVPEVAFLGRSNVGKSSLLNKLVTKAGGDTARVGKTPGATASVNLYALLGQSKRKGGNIVAGSANPLLGFADLPGFGYAKLSKETKESIEEAAERYLSKRRELALGVLLVDSRRVPTADDRAVLAALYDMGVPLIIVATKSDKLKGSEVESAMATIRDGLGLPDGQPLRVSGFTGEGVRDLWRIIMEACETRVKELKTSIQEGRDDGGVMRVALDEDGEGGDFYDDNFEDGEGVMDDEEFEDGEDVYYDQGFDWVQGETDDEEGSGDISGNFYDGDEFVDDYDDDYDDDVKRNQDKQQMEKEAFKLKNLEVRVAEMERRGEI